MQRRWAKLEKDFKIKPDKFDISKIPDVYDCIKYDLQHNQHTMQFQQAEELYTYAKALAGEVWWPFLSSQESGEVRRVSAFRVSCRMKHSNLSKSNLVVTAENN